MDEIWIGGRRIEALPAEAAPGEVIVVGSGAALTAILPLARTDIGRDAPIRLVEREGDLVLEIYNYLGPKKAFWELGWPGLFYKGRPQCGVYVEMAERSAYADGGAFGKVVASGELHDVTAPAYTYYGEGERPWTVEYRRDGQALGIEVDLMEWRLKRRWTEQGELGWPMLESPIARQNATGRVVVGEAVLGVRTRPRLALRQPRHRPLRRRLPRPAARAADSHRARRPRRGAGNGDRHGCVGQRTGDGRSDRAGK